MTKLPILLFAAGSITLFAARLWQTTGCVDFQSYVFNPIAITINVESQRKFDDDHLSQKIFHNKVTATGQEAGHSYSKLLEPRYILQVVGPLGLLMLVSSVYKAVVANRKLIKIHLVLLLLSPLLVITYVHPKLALYLMFLALSTFSLWSMPIFVKNKSAMLIFALFWLGTLLFFALNWRMAAICSQMVFK